MIPTQIKDNNYETYVGLNEPTGYNRKKVWLQHSTENLFSQNDLTVGYLDANGDIVSNPEFSVSAYINVQEFSGLYMQNNSGASERICFYNSNKTFISSINTTTYVNMLFYKPDNAYYMRTTVKNTKLTTYTITILDRSFILDNSNYTEFVPYIDYYNESEMKIGRWIDGKSIYRKIVHVNNVLVNNAYTKLLGASNVNEIITSNFIYMNKDANDYFTGIVWYDSDGILVMFTSIENTDIKFRFRGPGFVGATSNRHWYLIAEYTKTTD